MRIDFHPEAYAELANSAAWYAEQSQASAQRFAKAISTALERIVASELRYPLVGAEQRACSVTGFPFQIIFQHDGDRYFVIAVAHAKRRPEYWQDRV